MTMLAEAPAARPVTAAEVTDAVLDGAWIVDVRDRTRPEPRPEPSTTTPAPGPTPYVGWLVPWEDDIVLLAGSPQVLDAQSGSRWI